MHQKINCRKKGSTLAISEKVLDEIVDKSLDEFFLREAEVIVEQVAERNNCARLGIYLQQQAHNFGLTKYFADAEYNRKQGGQVKTIFGSDMKGVTIQCDLILHSRGESKVEDNLIAFEMKKAERSPQEKDADRERLRVMTNKSYGKNTWSNDGTTHPEHVCGYRIGVYLEISARDRSAKIEIYKNGKKVASKTRHF